MTSDKIRKKFIEFFVKNNHVAVESSTLWPQDDPSVLLTTAGMQQFKPYFLGTKDPKKDFGSTKLVSIQRCFRTSDIDEVGDPWHLTFFEMLGNFSIGDYFKQEAIELAWKFLVKKLHIDKNKLWITYYIGNNKVQKDKETIDIWKKYLPNDRIIGFGNKENWWGPPGNSGPCGPCTEIHYDFTGKPCTKGDKCLPNCECERFMELWNLVFMEFYMNEKGSLKGLPKKNIDTGMGLERLALILQKKNSIFETDLFEELMNKVKQNKNFGKINELEDVWRSRIVSDHMKGSFFLLSDGVHFSNKEQGYILRRIFRRSLDQYLHTNFEKVIFEDFLNLVINEYSDQYQHMQKRKKSIVDQIGREFDAYEKILQLDIEQVVQKIKNIKNQTKKLPRQGPSSRELSPQEAFILFTTYGLSPERLIQKGFKFDKNKFEKEIEKHQKLSRSKSKKKFGGHGINSSEWSDEDRNIIFKYHTATHLLHQALRDVLGDHVRQQGSDINPERLRFDFENSKKLTAEEKNKIEEILNNKINENLEVKSETMEYNKAIDSGALAFFKEKYPDNVMVYSIGNYSKELCSGPHVNRTGEIGKIKIVSEKSSSAGIRRIKAKIV